MGKYAKRFLTLVLSVMLVGTSLISASAFADTVTIDSKNIKLLYLDEKENADYVAVSGTLKSNDAVVSNQEIGIEKKDYDAWVANNEEEDEKISDITTKLNKKSEEVDAKQELVDSLDKTSEEYFTAKDELDKLIDEEKTLNNQYQSIVSEYGEKARAIIPDFDDDKWNKLTLKESTATENKYSAEPSFQYAYYVTWVKVTVNGEDYYNYSVNCLKEEVQVYVCKLVDGKYYDKDGKEVTEAEYNKSCNPICKVVDGKYYDNNGKEVTKDAYTKACGNPKTGINMYYTYGAVIVIAACGLYIATRKVKKLSK